MSAFSQHAPDITMLFGMRYVTGIEDNFWPIQVPIWGLLPQLWLYKVVKVHSTKADQLAKPSNGTMHWYSMSVAISWSNNMVGNDLVSFQNKVTNALVNYVAAIITAHTSLIKIISYRNRSWYHVLYKVFTSDYIRSLYSF